MIQNQVCNEIPDEKDFDINTWSTQVKDELTKFKKILDSSPEHKDLYKGLRIFYGPYIKHPTVLFVGYNPGAGHDQEGDIWTDPTEFEYGMGWDGFRLAEETESIFSAAGLEDIFYNQSTKINCFSLLTKGVGEFKKLKSFLDEETNGEFSRKSSQRLKQLVCAMSPRIIICEGKMAFDELTAALDLRTPDIEWQNDATYISTNKFTIIGYKRRYSDIRDKDRVSDLLKTFLKDES